MIGGKRGRPKGEQLSAVILVLASYHVHLCNGASDWSYTGSKGPAQWSDRYPKCGGSQQSPVDVRNAKPAEWLTPLEFKNYDEVIKDATIINNGHTVQLTSLKSEAKLSGGCLRDRYTFMQLHFHWGANDTLGSEHTMAGRTYPMEAHLVHKSDRFDNLDDALKDPEGLAVLAVMYTITRSSGEATTSLDPILKFLENNREMEENAVKFGSKIKLSSFLPDDLSRYYCYRRGSLTTPECHQAVVWTILHDTVKVTRNQLDYFRKAKDSHGKALVNNFRPVQPLNGRVLYFYNSAPAIFQRSLLLLIAGLCVTGSRGPL